MPSDFDVNAAWLRKSQEDLGAFLDALASRLDSALPGQVTIERRRDGLFSKTSHLSQLTVNAHEHVYALQVDKGHVQARRSKSVHGVTLSSEQMSMPQWLKALFADVEQQAQDSSAAHHLLNDFLMF